MSAECVCDYEGYGEQPDVYHAERVKARVKHKCYTPALSRFQWGTGLFSGICGDS